MPQSPAPALRFHEVDWTPPRRPDQAPPQRVLHGVSLTLGAGEVGYVLGNSGSGKSSLLKLANRLLDCEHGKVEVLGREVRQCDVRWLRRRAVYVPQRPSMLTGCLSDELRTPLRWQQRNASDVELRHVLEIVQLEEISLDHACDALSEGQAARVALARALLLEPAVLLLDEPTAALDVRTARELLDALGTWQRERGASLLCVTHRVHELGALPGRAVVLLDGQVRGTYSTDTLLTDDTDPAVAAFLGTLGRST